MYRRARRSREDCCPAMQAVVGMRRFDVGHHGVKLPKVGVLMCFVLMLPVMASWAIA